MLNLFVSKCRLMAMRAFILLSCIYMPFAWSSGFGIDTTRVIIEQQAGSANVFLRNTSDTPYLVRAEVLDAAWQPVKGFSVNPGLLRMDADSKSVVRVLHSPIIPLPQDRESVFYLHCTVIASGAEIEQRSELNKAALKVAVGTRIKLFYRPTGIVAPKKDIFAKLVITKQQGGLRVDNPTPYNVSLDSLSVDGYKLNLSRELHMIAPFSQQTFTVDRKLPMKEVTWTIVNDVGGYVSYQGAIQ